MLTERSVRFTTTTTRRRTSEIVLGRDGAEPAARPDPDLDLLPIWARLHCKPPVGKIKIKNKNGENGGGFINRPVGGAAWSERSFVRQGDAASRCVSSEAIPQSAAHCAKSEWQTARRRDAWRVVNCWSSRLIWIFQFAVEEQVFFFFCVPRRPHVGMCGNVEMGNDGCPSSDRSRRLASAFQRCGTSCAIIDWRWQNT